MNIYGLFTDFKAHKSTLLVGFVLVLSLLATGVFWISKPSYMPLYDKLDEKQQADVIAALVDWKVDYKIDGSPGLIMVLSRDINQLRGRLAVAGITQKNSKGYELFDNADYGMSEFSQKINYQRALEGELARSIMSLDGIRLARVHLTLAKNSLFESNRTMPKASVIIESAAKEALSNGQIHGIQKLISAAIDGLDPLSVTILDSHGRSLVSDASDGGLDRSQWLSSQQTELEQRARELLNGTLGTDDSAVSVRIQANFDKIHSIRDVIVLPDAQPAGVVVRKKEHRSDSSVSSGSDTENATRKGSPVSTQTEVEYAFGKEHSDIEKSVGTIERITLGVVLKHSASSVKVTELESVLSAGLGLDQARGDRIVVSIGHIATKEDGMNSLAVEPSGTVSVTNEHVNQKNDSPALALNVAAIVVLTIVFFTVLYFLRRIKPVTRQRMSEMERMQMLEKMQTWILLAENSGSRQP